MICLIWSIALSSLELASSVRIQGVFQRRWPTDANTCGLDRKPCRFISLIICAMMAKVKLVGWYNCGDGNNESIGIDACHCKGSH